MKFSAVRSGLTFLAAVSLCFLPSLSTSTSSSQPTAGAAQAQSLRWYDDLRMGMIAARTGRRWILVDCYTDWCHWCKKLDTDVFENATVARQLGDHFVWVKCNTEDEAKGVWVKDKYGVQGYPSILILDPSGNEKGRIQGYLPPQAFINRVAKIITH